MSVILYFQRKFINEEPGKAHIPRQLYTNMKKWVASKYPRGLGESEWDALVEEVDTLYVQVAIPN